MLFVQGNDLSGQGPDETHTFCRRAENEVVVPTVHHSVFGCVLSVHASKVPFLLNDINQMVAPNIRFKAATVFRWILAEGGERIREKSASW